MKTFTGVNTGEGGYINFEDLYMESKGRKKR